MTPTQKILISLIVGFSLGLLAYPKCFPTTRGYSSLNGKLEGLYNLKDSLSNEIENQSKYIDSLVNVIDLYKTDVVPVGPETTQATVDSSDYNSAIRNAQKLEMIVSKQANLIDVQSSKIVTLNKVIENNDNINEEIIKQIKKEKRRAFLVGIGTGALIVLLIAI